MTSKTVNQVDMNLNPRAVELGPARSHSKIASDAAKFIQESSRMMIHGNFVAAAECNKLALDELAKIGK